MALLSVWIQRTRSIPGISEYTHVWALESDVWESESDSIWNFGLTARFKNLKLDKKNFKTSHYWYWWLYNGDSLKVLES